MRLFIEFIWGRMQAVSPPITVEGGFQPISHSHVLGVQAFNICIRAANYPRAPCDSNTVTHQLKSNRHTMADVRNDVLTQVYFLKRDPTYDDEKPYSLRFTPPEGFPRANILLESHDVAVHDIRPIRNELTIDKNGYAIMSLETDMTYDDFDNEQRIKDVYLRELSEALRSYLGAKRVQIFEHTVGNTAYLSMHTHTHIE